MSVEFTDEDFEKMEKKSVELLGWSLSEKCGMSLKEMIEKPEEGKFAIRKAKNQSGLIDKFKLNKILEYLQDPNWQEILKKKLG